MANLVKEFIPRFTLHTQPVNILNPRIAGFIGVLYVGRLRTTATYHEDRNGTRTIYFDKTVEQLCAMYKDMGYLVR